MTYDYINHTDVQIAQSTTHCLHCIIAYFNNALTDCIFTSYCGGEGRGGEGITVLSSFSFLARFLYHCHVLPGPGGFPPSPGTSPGLRVQGHSALDWIRSKVGLAQSLHSFQPKKSGHEASTLFYICQNFNMK